MRILAKNKEAGITLTYNNDMFFVKSNKAAKGFCHLNRALQFYDNVVEDALKTPPSDLEAMTQIARELINLADEWVEGFRYEDLARKFDRLTAPKTVTQEGWINIYPGNSSGGV
jgi:hypothetical protein